MKPDIYIIGVGPYSIVIAELAESCGYQVKGYYHYNNERNNEVYFGKKIISSTNELFNNDITSMNFALSMGNNDIRLTLASQLREKGAMVPSLIHPSVEVSASATVGEGVILKRNVSIQAVTSIGKDTIVADNSVVCHHSDVDMGCFIASGSIVGAYTHLEKKVFIGQGVTIPSGKVKSIGEGAFVSAGSVVIKDVAKHEVVIGNPAKHLRFIEP